MNDSKKPQCKDEPFVRTNWGTITEEQERLILERALADKNIVTLIRRGLTEPTPLDEYGEPSIFSPLLGEAQKPFRKIVIEVTSGADVDPMDKSRVWSILRRRIGEIV